MTNTFGGPLKLLGSALDTPWRAERARGDAGGRQVSLAPIQKIHADLGTSMLMTIFFSSSSSSYSLMLLPCVVKQKEVVLVIQ
eukprot:2166660-Pyramimonas_sp.AAC.1